MSLLNAPQPPLCQLYPVWMAVLLRQAAQFHFMDDRVKAIDNITDRLAAQGYCRERDSISRAEEWARIRRISA